MLRSPILSGRDAPVPVLTDIGSCFGTETDQHRLEPIGTDRNQLEPKPEPIRTDCNRNRNRSEPIATETETQTDQNRLEPIHVCQS